MAFRSLEFLYFFALFYALYLVLQKQRRLQNLLLLAACYVFYGWGGWRMALLIGGLTLLDYLVGLGLGPGKDEKAARLPRGLLLFTSLGANLGALVAFKYFNFFAGSFFSVLNRLGVEAAAPSLNLALPLGISFFTLKSMSYVIDVYQRRSQPTRSLLEYAIYVAFFPALPAGPMDRAHVLLPQIARPRSPSASQTAAGVYLLIWGFFKKLVVADNLANVVNPVFADPAQYAGADYLLAVLAFGVQIYADFSAYSDIGRGLAKLLGFELTINFRLPFLALNPTDFWQRWHISFSEWLRDYIFFPSRRALLKLKFLPELLPPMITMLVSGLWHGAGWTFLLWGGYHGLLMVLYRRFEKRPIHQDPWNSGQAFPLVGLRIVLMLALVSFGWLFFRAESVGQVWYMLSHFRAAASEQSLLFATDLLFYSAPLILMDTVQYASGNLLVATRLPAPLRALFYALLLAGIILLAPSEVTEFIYAQF